MILKNKSFNCSQHQRLYDIKKISHLIAITRDFMIFPKISHLIALTRDFMILKKISHLIALTRDWRLNRMTISFNNRSWEFGKTR